MNTLPSEPSARDRISATWMRELVRYVRSITPIQGPGINLSRGPNGTVFSSKRPAKAGAASFSQPPSCWMIDSVEREFDDDTGKITFLTVNFANCYYSVGGKIYELSGAKVEVGDPEGSIFVYFEISAKFGESPSPKVDVTSSFDKIIEKSLDEDKFVLPLYGLAQDGTVECDLRNMPKLVMGELQS